MLTFSTDTPFETKKEASLIVPTIPKYTEQRGFLYIVKSKAFPEVVKIGRTIDFNKRLKQYNTDQPYNTFQPIVISHLFPNVIEAETKILDYLYINLIQPTTLKHEWFSIEHQELLISLIQQAEDHYGEWF